MGDCELKEMTEGNCPLCVDVIFCFVVIVLGCSELNTFDNRQINKSQTDFSSQVFQWQPCCLECLHISCKTNTYFCVVLNVRLIELLSPLWSPASIHIRLIFSSLCSLLSIHQTVCPCKFLPYEFIHHSWRQND